MIKLGVCFSVWYIYPNLSSENFITENMLSVVFLDYEGAPLGNSQTMTNFLTSQYFLSTGLHKLSHLKPMLTQVLIIGKAIIKRKYICLQVICSFDKVNTFKISFCIKIKITLTSPSRHVYWRSQELSHSLSSVNTLPGIVSGSFLYNVPWNSSSLL